VFGSSLNYKLLEHIKAHSDGKATLIFCNTRKSTVQAAEQLEKEYQALVKKRSGPLPWTPARGRELRFADAKLKQLAASGIAFHHAGLAPEDRKTVEAAFINGQLKVLATTSTLAVGVNLPARLVIVRGTDQYDAVTGCRPYPAPDVLQMIGRAGRPQFDTFGVAVILTALDQKSNYDQMLENKTVLESSLHKNLTEHICSELVLGTLTTIEQALQWLRTTFLWQRMQKNPAHYGIAGATINASPAERLEQLVVDTIRTLTKDRLCDAPSFEPTGSIAPTTLGQILSRFCISHATFQKLNALQQADSKAVLIALCSAKVPTFRAIDGVRR
jgi:ATP-dependent DNA helicase HFM1/MER3